jgi:hypothetical protein
MNKIETALTKMPYSPDFSSDNVPVWNGSAWVSQKIVNAQVDAAAAIAYSKLNLAASIARTDMAAGFKTTVGTIAAGPPASPTTNDIWIATDVDSNGTCWMFRYNSAEATYKWEFIGGPPVRNQGDPNAVANTKTQVGSSGYYYDSATMSITLARAGDYWIEGAAGIGSNGGAAGLAAANTWQGTTVSSGMAFGLAPAVSTIQTGWAGFVMLGISAGQVAGIAGLPVAAGTNTLRSSSVAITPIRII